MDRAALVVVHGHREGNAAGGMPWISDECLARVRAAERAATRYRATRVLFCGAGEKGFPSEAAQMSQAWRGPRVRHFLDERSKTTAQNAEEALRWATQLGVTRLIVVSSWWHVRLSIYYRPFARVGIAVQRTRSWRCRRIVTYLQHELRYLPEALWR
jgi:uncharacterized SAM-binding protein YcdF (DUF218 family)